MGDLAQLNRLRVNAGKGELKSWKASRETLDAQIARLLDEGFTDALPGANLNVAPVAPPDPEIARVLAEQNKPVEEEFEEAPSLADSALGKMIANGDSTPNEAREASKVKAKLARGLDTDGFAYQSRVAVQMARSKEKRDADAAKPKKPTLTERVKLSKADKKQIKDEKKLREQDANIVGKVDEKKEPAKAARQKQHIEDKRAKRAEKPAKEKDDKNFTVAELARDLDIDPKVARAKLRRHEDDIAPLHSKGQDRWTFPNAARPVLEKILSGKK